MTRAVYAVAAAVVVTTDEPTKSLEFEVAFVAVFTKFTRGVTFVKHVTGVNDCNSGKAGICTGDLISGLFSFAASVDTQGDVLGTQGNSNIVDVGLPIHVIECLNALPFLGLDPLADLVLANSL